MTHDNRVILTGRVAKTAQRSYRPDGSSVTQFLLELNDPEGLSSRSGRSLIDIVAFDPVAESMLDHLQKDQFLRVEGRLRQRRWQTPEGKSRSRVEVIATDLRIMKGDEPN